MRSQLLPVGSIQGHYYLLTFAMNLQRMHAYVTQQCKSNAKTCVHNCNLSTIIGVVNSILYLDKPWFRDPGREADFYFGTARSTSHAILT